MKKNAANEEEAARKEAKVFCRYGCRCAKRDNRRTCYISNAGTDWIGKWSKIVILFTIQSSKLQSKKCIREHMANALKWLPRKRISNSRAKCLALDCSKRTTTDDWWTMKLSFIVSSGTSTSWHSSNHLRMAQTFTWFNHSVRISRWARWSSKKIRFHWRTVVILCIKSSVAFNTCTKKVSFIVIWSWTTSFSMVICRWKSAISVWPFTWTMRPARQTHCAEQPIISRPKPSNSSVSNDVRTFGPSVSSLTFWFLVKDHSKPKPTKRHSHGSHNAITSEHFHVKISIAILCLNWFCFQASWRCRLWTEAIFLGRFRIESSISFECRRLFGAAILPQAQNSRCVVKWHFV